MRHFEYSEFDQKGYEGSGKEHMDPTFLMHLDELRHRCDFIFIVISGYRSPEYNNQVSSTGFTGPHTTGKAADIAVNTSEAFILMEQVIKMPVFTSIFTGIGVGKGFIHLDTLTPEEAPRPRLWGY